MLRRASRMSPADAQTAAQPGRPPVRPTRAEAAMAAVVVMATEAIGRCTVPFAALVAKRLRSPSSPQVANRSIARIASSRDDQAATKKNEEVVDASTTSFCF
jgi:hypothetical protein